MALSGSVSSGSYDGRHYKVSWTASQSVTNNNSTISWTLEALGGDDSWYAERTLKVVIANTTVYSKTNRVERYKGVIDEGTITISHSNEGNASFGISIEAAVYYSTVNCTGSDTFSLNTIPRKSTLSVGDGTLGTAQTLTVTRQSTSFTHTITYKVGGTTGTICDKSTNTSISFTPPLTLAAYNSTGTSLSITYTITTYSGSTSVGSNSYTKSLSIPSNEGPKIHSVTISEAATLPAVYGSYMRNLSQLRVSILATGGYGATVKSIISTVDGYTYADSFVTGPITSAGTVPITCTVTDSRGRQTVYNTSVSVTDYSPPVITSLNAYRTNEHGAADDQGLYVTVSCLVEYPCYYDSSKWNTTFELKYKKSTGDSYTLQALEPNTLSLVSGYTAREQYMYTFPADTSSSYDINVTCGDIYGNFASKNSTVSTAATIMHIPASGEGLGIGKVVENDGDFEIGYPMHVYETATFHNRTHMANMFTYDIPICDSGYDCNNMPGSGLYYMGTNALHKPMANTGYQYNGWLQVFRASAETEYQLYTTYNGIVGERFKELGKWGRWMHVRTYMDDEVKITG